MTITFKITGGLLAHIRSDLRRPHAHAAERVGFISVKAAAAAENLLLLGCGYHLVDDEDYLVDSDVGARIGSNAIRKSLEIALRNPVGVFHVHMHEHAGVPYFSSVDLSGQRQTVPDFFKIRRGMPHGAVVLSDDNAAGSCWSDKGTVSRIDRFVVVAPVVQFLPSFPRPDERS